MAFQFYSILNPEPLDEILWNDDPGVKLSIWQVGQMQENVTD